MSIEVIISLIAALGVGGVLGAILNRRFEQQKQTNEHDIKIFNESNQILQEQKLRDITFFHLLASHSIDREDLTILGKWCVFFNQIGNHFLDKKTHKENRKLLVKLERLLHFISINFFRLRDPAQGNNALYLRPDWNFDLDGDVESMEKYERYASEFESLCEEVIEQYSVCRRIIKKQLKI